jgi:hypothetical protein
MIAPALWIAGAAVVGGYVLLFLAARRPVSLRLPRLGGLLATLAVLRLALIAAGTSLDSVGETIGTTLTGIAALALLLARRVWIVRATAAELREQVETVCRGLFLGAEATPSRLQLAASGKPVLRLVKLAPRMQLLVLPRVAGPGKVALLCNWLAKQYPGPVPRVRIILKGGAS